MVERNFRHKVVIFHHLRRKPVILIRNRQIKNEQPKLLVFVLADLSAVRLFTNVSSQVNNTAGVTPFVVVPGHDFQHGVIHNHGGQTVNDTGTVIAVVVDRYQWFVGVAQDAFHFAFGSSF